MEEKNDINKILEMLNESVTSGLYFEIRAEDSKTLLEYIDAQHKELGAERIKNEIRKTDSNILAKRIEEYEKTFQEIDVEDRRKKSREIQEKIDKKTSELCKYKRKIEHLRSEVINTMEYLGIEVYD